MQNTCQDYIILYISKWEASFTTAQVKDNESNHNHLFFKKFGVLFFWMCTHQWGHVHVIKENDRMMAQGNYVWTDGHECNVNEVTCCHSDKNHSLFVKQESVYSLIESLSLSFSSSHFFCFVLSFIFCCIAVLFSPVCSLATRAFWCLLDTV